MRRLPRQSGTERGFSILELIVAMLIAVEILVAMAIAFDVHNKIARVQLQVTDMQQSLRVAQWDIARLVRMAGRGGLKADLDPDAVFDPTATPPEIRGRALEIRNNVTGDERYIRRDDTSAATPTAFEGTDILTVRGCFSTPVYQIDPGTFEPDADEDGEPDGEVTLEIPANSVAGLPQPLEDLMEQYDAYDPGAPIKGRLLLGSWASRDDWGIAHITEIDDTDPTKLVVTLDLDTDSPLNPLVDHDNDAATAEIRTLPLTIAPSSACLLEEYRYYIRDQREDDDPITPLRPRLTRARFEPGTEEAYLGNVSNLSLDLADQVFDLQVALGLDTDYMLGFDASLPGSYEGDEDEIGEDDKIYEAATETVGENRGLDDWLYNDPADDPDDPGGVATANRYVYHSYSGLAGDPVQLYFVRITTAARTFRPDTRVGGGSYQYTATDFDTRDDGDWLEDNDYDDTDNAANVFKTGNNVHHRYRMLTTTVEMRNI